MLTDAKIRAAKPRPQPCKLTDASRLYLLVTPSDGELRRWSYATGNPVREARSASNVDRLWRRIHLRKQRIDEGGVCRQAIRQARKVG